jgi:hypothetical protein
LGERSKKTNASLIFWRCYSLAFVTYFQRFLCVTWEVLLRTNFAAYKA